ncbi:saccharopine dehydrogenase NADP-binding domain-containing protein [Oligoflexia bacterium]|nr:saccharopine dehydrogenase NADP-binding domain-containing protein [Oligoflexia bacterium]
MRILVLGAGIVGRAIAIDLCADEQHQVTVCDIRGESLTALKDTYPVLTHQANLSTPEAVHNLAKQHEFVVSAVPGYIGFQTLQAIIEADCSVVDIAFFPEDPFELAELAEEHGVTAVVDCGVAPGMSNLLVGHSCKQLDTISDVKIYAAGLPIEKTPPFEYKAVFSPMDVIEEYVRPARIVKDGEKISMPALSESEMLDFPEIGTLEAFHTDGLRTLLTTIGAPNMVEKTMRYPGHRAKVELLRDIGFFSDEIIAVENTKVAPRSLTSKLLMDCWKLEPGDEDVTVLRVVVNGTKNGKNIQFIHNLIDYYDQETGMTSMARTTGFAATAFARAVLNGQISQKGVVTPEAVGTIDVAYKSIMSDLEVRGINYNTVKKDD